MRAKELAAFMKIRENHRLLKGKGRHEWPKGWTPDPIIAKYRFCNVRREDDRVSKYVRQWSQQWAGNPDQWFCFVVARLFNLPFTLGLIKDTVVPFKPEKMRNMLHDLADHGNKIFNAAYIVSTNGRVMDKVDYLIDLVLTPIWAKRKGLGDAIGRGVHLNYMHELLMAQQGLGSFMAAQIVADIKYEPPNYDKALELPTPDADDWYTFAASGPGSRRGLNRVMGRAASKVYREAQWRTDLEALHKALLPMLPASIGATLHRQDLQNCLCEFDKYERARTGEGKPKQLYVPHEEK